jgi:hypothetical protein
VEEKKAVDSNVKKEDRGDGRGGPNNVYTYK